jgi:YidC/Oxa1 family membrane protein insertase
MMLYLHRRSASGPAREGQPPAPSGQRWAQSATAPAGGATAPAGSLPARTAAIGPATASAPASLPQRRWRNDAYPVGEAFLGSLEQDSGYKLQVQLTSLGAAIRTVKLTDYFTTVADKKRHGRDPATYEQAVLQDKNLKGHYSLMNPVGLGGRWTYALATEQIGLMADHVWLDVSGPRWQAGPVGTDADGTQQVTFASEVYRDGQPYLRLLKRYSLRKNSYSIGVHLQVVNLTDQAVEVKVRQLGPTGVPREDVQADRRALAWGHYLKGDLKVSKASISETGKMPLGLDAGKRLGRSDGPDPVAWVGLSNKFFAALAYVLPRESQTLAAPQAKAEFFRSALEESPTSRTYLAAMDLGPYELADRQAEPEGLSLDLDLFAGPKKRDLFDGSELYRNLHYKETLDFGSCCTWAPLTLGMMWLLDVLHQVTFRNYGLAIILLVGLVRVALHPLTKKSQVSMMGMQKLQPEMARLREKHKDDKAKLNEEMMKLYKQQGTTPILGCLPMALQMPIWIALWTGLSAAVELRQAPLLPFWITDLAAPDTLFSWGNPMTATSWPVVGPLVSFNLLPVLLTVAMAIQQKMTPTTTAPANEAQARTQRQMMYFMTGFFALLFYNAPSGLTLYIMASTFAGVVEQVVIRKHIKKKEALEAAAETRVEIPGGYFRGQRPKKPKGPFRF